MTQEDLDKILKEHAKWLIAEEGGNKADLRYASLCKANLRYADLRYASLCKANLRYADLRNVNLRGANLRYASLRKADLRYADLRYADLYNADLRYVNLRGANLYNADLRGVTGMIKIMGVEVGNYYWKRIGENFENNSYQYKIGLNKLRKGEEFAADERVTRSYPGFHFSSRSWATRVFGNRPYEAKIRIPEGAQINEPWATDGEASADMIEIVQVFKNGEDVTEELRAKGE